MDIGYKIRKGFFKTLEAVIEAVVVFFTSFLLTFIQEVVVGSSPFTASDWRFVAWRATGRTFSSFVAIVLGFLNKPAFERWVNEHRSRIAQVTAPVPSLKEKSRKPTITLVEGKRIKKAKDSRSEAKAATKDPKYVENLEIPKPELKIQPLRKRKLSTDDGGYETEKEREREKGKEKEKSKSKQRDSQEEKSQREGAELEAIDIDGAIGLGIPNEFQPKDSLKLSYMPHQVDTEIVKEKRDNGKKPSKDAKEGNDLVNSIELKKPIRCHRKGSMSEALNHKVPRPRLRTKSAESILEEEEEAPSQAIISPQGSPKKNVSPRRMSTRKSFDSVGNPLEQTYDEETDQDIEYSVDDLPRDKLFTHEKIHTGFIEDIRISMMVTIMSIRAWITDTSNSFFDAVSEFRFRNLFRSMLSLDFWLSPILWLISLIYLLARVTWSLIASPTIVPKSIGLVTSSFIERRIVNVDKSDRKSMLESKGYPFEQHRVVTDDGYILTLERLPRPNSTKVLYLQHGVFDSAYAWFAETHHVGMNIAFRAHDLGYDVFAGTLRGCAPAKEHINSNISARDFWNFTVNEHAFKDIPAFIAKIRELKASELGIDEADVQVEVPNPGSPPPLNPSLTPNASPKLTLSVVSHSMGAMATLMYLVKCRIDGKPHHVTSAILLSPAGYHKTAPWFCKLTGPFISAFLWAFPWATYSFRFPSEFVRTLVAKMVEDVRENYSSRQLLSFMAYKLLGGDKTDHTYIRAHNITYNVFSGTSAGIFKHFWQVWKSQKFEAYDYGPDKNLQYYGQTEPINFFENYKLIDIPLYFVMGLRDTLIEPVSVMAHFDKLYESHPELAHLKAFPKMGHIDFTVGENSEVSNFIFESLGHGSGEA